MEGLSLLLTFGVGAVAFCSPWVLAMFPALFGFLSGEVAGSATDHRSIRKKFWKNAVFFVLGFSITMVVPNSKSR